MLDYSCTMDPYNIGIQMKQKELTKTFMTILSRNKLWSDGLYENKLAL